MKRAVVMTATAMLLAFAAQGCTGYTDGTGSLAADSGSTGAPPPAPDAGPGSDEPPRGDAGTTPVPPPPDDAEPDADVNTPDAGTADAGEPPPTGNLRIARSSEFESYLTDSAGRALYMFANDIAGSKDSACLGDCARAWPPFDVLVAEPGAGIDSAYVSRFHRQDGLWQTTYKGHALYYRAAEAGTRVVTGDGVDGRWFVARNYFAFLSTARTFAPAGGAGMSAFLTDGFGRTLYVCLDDQPRTAAAEAVSSCDVQCTVRRPTFTGDVSNEPILPSVLRSADVLAMQRSDGQPQLTYRGWPLYYFHGDVTAGATEGHNDRAWRAIDPLAFGTNN